MPRTKTFRPEEALEQAMGLFWSRGYESVSVEDLVEATGVNRFSLYETFGDKHQLYLSSIDHYSQTRIDKALARLESGKDAKKEIREYFDNLLDSLCTEGGRRGCYLANCAIETAPHDLQVAERVEAYLQRLEQALYEALRKLKGKGEADKDNRLRRGAAFLSCCVQGLSVLSRANASRKSLEGVVKTALRQVG